jgi:hypothetical protein
MGSDRPRSPRASMWHTPPRAPCAARVDGAEAVEHEGQFRLPRHAGLRAQGLGSGSCEALPPRPAISAWAASSHAPPAGHSLGRRGPLPPRTAHGCRRVSRARQRPRRQDPGLVRSRAVPGFSWLFPLLTDHAADRSSLTGRLLLRYSIPDPAQRWVARQHGCTLSRTAGRIWQHEPIATRPRGALAPPPRARAEQPFQPACSAAHAAHKRRGSPPVGRPGRPVAGGPPGPGGSALV